MKSLLPLFFCCLLSFTGIGILTVPASAQTGRGIARQNSFAQKSTAALPFCFIENNGQITDDAGKTHPEVLFKARSGNTQVFLGQAGIYYAFTQTEYPQGYSPDNIMYKGLQEEAALRGKIKTSVCRMEVKLLHANATAKVIREEESSYYENYFLPQCPGGLTAHGYSRVTYKDIYPGIDWVLYTNATGRMEYDFVVHPSGNPDDIKLHVAGASINITEDGRLQMQTSLGQVEEAAPVANIAGQPVTAHFRQTADGDISFAVAPCDRTADLVIDPTVAWATYYGGSGPDMAYGCATDASGNVYMTGNTGSGNFPVKNAVQSYNALGGDAFLVKFAGNGTVLWATYYGGGSSFGGGSGDDFGFSCTTDPAGNVYMVGQTSATNFPVKHAVQDTAKGGGDAFIVKLTGSGDSVLWATYFGGAGSDCSYGCATDASGNVFMTGYTNSPDFPVSSNAFQTLYKGGGNDASIVKFSSSGSVLWATYFGGNGDDYAYNCATDASGNVYTTGRSGSSNLPVSNAVQNSNAGGLDAMMIKLSSSGSLLWATYYGGSGMDQAAGCATDAAGNVYMAGYTQSANFPVSNAVHSSNAGGEDAFMVKFSSSGPVLWSTYYGGSSSDEALSCATDPAGNVYMTGYTASSNFPVTSDAIQSASAGAYYTTFMVKFGSSGSSVYGATYYGGSGLDYARSCAADASGNVYMTGYTTSANFPVSSGALQSSIAGSYSPFMVKMHFIDPTGISTPAVVRELLSVYPNPVSDLLTIKCETPWNITDIAGRIMASGNKGLELSVSKWPAGMYLLHTNGITKKIIKE